MRVLFSVVAVAVALAFPAAAQDSGQQETPPVAPFKSASATSTPTITPIFSQLVVVPLPANFKVAHQQFDNVFFIREAVPPGETVHNWSQMVTVTSNKDLAQRSAMTPEIYAGTMAAQFRKTCPSTFTAYGYGAVKFETHDAYVALIGCGSIAGPQAAHSEIMLVVVIKGSQDYYTVQWAERGPSLPVAPVRDDAKWLGRLKQISPIRLCPIVPGEPAPYVSCIGG